MQSRAERKRLRLSGMEGIGWSWLEEEDQAAPGGSSQL